LTSAAANNSSSTKFIESIRGVELVMNRPYHTGMVLITADKPWELEPHEGYRDQEHGTGDMA